MALISMQLITLYGEKVNADVYEVIVPSVTGQISIFPGHEPLVTLAAPGVIMVRQKKEDEDRHMELYAISGGVVEVSPEAVRILVDEAESGDDIVEAESREALERALKLRDEATSQVDLEKAHQMVDRHQVRLKVAELRRRHRS